MLDSDLAEMYGIKTFRLNEQVKRNSHRFPSDFMFQRTLLSTQEELEKKIMELESKYDDQFRIIFQAIKELMRQEAHEQDERKAIGYKILGSE